MWSSVGRAEESTPDWLTWDEAKREHGYWGRYGYRIWDHSTTPPTDVTDADPDAVTERTLWDCQWHSFGGFQTRPAMNGPADTTIEWNFGCELRNVIGQVESATEPTFAEFAAAVKDVTGVEIPQPEEPQWWTWDMTMQGLPAYWRKAETTSGAQVNRCFVTVWGTRDTIDAKRDRLLAAAREAGKP